MTEEETIAKLLDYAEEFGFREHSMDPMLKIYTVDIRGTITHDQRLCSIQVDFHDVHAYHADGRKVTYCEGNASVLQRHLEMNDSPMAVVEWAKQEKWA